MSTYTNLKNQYSSYIASQCDGNLNNISPGSCEAAQKYVNDLNDFVEKAKDETQKSIPEQQNLLNQRIKNQEHRNIYPLLNYDFDYKTAMKKVINPYAIGITNKPSFDNLVTGTSKLSNYIDALATNRFPNENTIAGVTDIVEENPDRKKIRDLTAVEDEKLPYSSFKNDYPECLYPTKGEGASSYFIRAGTCPTRIINKEECLQKGYEWVDQAPSPSEYSKYVGSKDTSKDENIPSSDTPMPPPQPPKGKCFKPRFIYIDNKARGILGQDGAVPSIFKDLEEITPDKISDIMSGYGISGSGIVPCSTEEFTVKNNVSSSLSLVLLIGILGFSVYVGINK
jgi:hypothetical protein